MKTERVWEIDFIRTIAIIMMVIFHFVYDLVLIADYSINYKSGFWFWQGQLAALLFIFVSGISSGFTSRAIRIVGLQLFSLGMLISMASFLYFADNYVRFGILHLLGTAMFVYPWLQKLSVQTLSWLAGLLFAGGMLAKYQTVNTFLLIPIGFMYPGFRSVDYYPLMPYLAVFILGVIAWKIWYYRGMSLFSFAIKHPIINFLSSHSLAIYVLHQPILIVMILFLLRLNIL